MTGSYNKFNKVEDTMSWGTAIYPPKGKNGLTVYEYSNKQKKNGFKHEILRSLFNALR